MPSDVAYEVEKLSQWQIFDLAQPLESNTPVSPAAPPFRHALTSRHGDAPPGASPRLDEMTGSSDLLVMGGHTGTHIDALCHVAHKGIMYGGLDAYEAQSSGRFSVHGVETIQPIVGRGLLLDVPRAHGLDQWPAGEPIKAEHLQVTCDAKGVQVGQMDTVLIRTGWPIGRWSDPSQFVGHGTGVPGPDLSAAQWLSSRGVRAVGSDTIAFEWIPPMQGHSNMAAHVHLIAHHGIHIIEVLALEDVASAGVVEFLFVLAPLKLVGATGSPCRPLALVPGDVSEPSP